MPTPSQKDLIVLIRKGRLEKAMQDLTDAADAYVDRYGLIESIKEAYMSLAICAGQLSEIQKLKIHGSLDEQDAQKSIGGLQGRFMDNFDKFPESFWSNEAPPIPKPKAPLPNRPVAHETTDTASAPPPVQRAVPSPQPTPPPIPNTSNYQPSSGVPPQVQAVLQEYRNKLFIAEMDMPPMDFKRTFDFLGTFMPQVPIESVYFAFTEKYFWQLSGIVLTSRYLWVKDTFTAQPVYFDYNFIQSIVVTNTFPQSIIFNGQINYALGALTAEQRYHFRDFLEKMVTALRGV